MSGFLDKKDCTLIEFKDIFLTCEGGDSSQSFDHISNVLSLHREASGVFLDAESSAVSFLNVVKCSLILT